jgi:protocatechuate 4,5-dioxygenase alpha chain
MATRRDQVLINQLFYDVQKADGLAQFRADPEAFLDRYAFSPEVRAAIAHTDIGAMYRAGANPYLLRFFCVNLGVPEQEYVAALHAIREQR